MARPAWPDRFLTALKKHGTITGAAQAVKVGRRTVYDEMERNPEFRDDVHAILTACVELVEATLYQQALDPDKTTDRIFYLKTRKPEVYGDKLRQDQVDQIRAEARREALQEIDRAVAELTPEAQALLVRAMRKQETNPKELTP